MKDEGEPLWRWLIVGALCSYAAIHFLLAGEIAVNKARTTFLTRAADPLAYWLIVLVLAALGAAALYKAWKRLASN